MNVSEDDGPVERCAFPSVTADWPAHHAFLHISKKLSNTLKCIAFIWSLPVVCGDVLIRPMSIDDAVEFNRVVGVVAREHRYLRFLDAPPMDGTVEFLRDSLAAGNPHLAAVVGDELVGWCDVCRSSFEIEGHVGRLGIGLLPAQRGQGLGKALLDVTIAAAERLDFQRIELTAFSDNHRAIALYETRGFVREGVMRAAARFGDEYRDVVLMGRLGSGLGGR